MATPLKRLDLHGFKSFASPTTFVFDTGITAIIGPNGSGKSNISDALRWVLGEQSYTNLRGRRTEDIIFAGTTTRAPLGMAEVTVTLDNEDGGLPVAFSEVSVTRRAYRSGENQYLINGARVRLKDVLQVTASLGQSHTVIGQGLVDTVLSQRVDERRGLFEHAAGITGLRLKHASAGRNLEESQANCTRLEDLLADIEPRLRALERAARQAREYDEVKRQLRAALERFHARHWQQAINRLHESMTTAEALASELDQAQRDRDNRRQVLVDASNAVAARLSALETLRDDLQRLNDQVQRVSHELALIQERRIAAHNRRGDAENTLVSIQVALDNLTREIDDLTRDWNKLRHASTDRERTLHALDAAHAESRRVRTALEAQLHGAHQRLAHLERDAMLNETRATLLRGQRAQLEAERERHQAESSEREIRRAELAAQVKHASQELAIAAQESDRLSRQLQDLTDDIAARSHERDALAKRHAGIERQMVETSTRYETLKRIEESGVGLYAGVRQVLEAVRNGRLSGILGTLVSLLIVPAELEAAIEAALGGHLQDLVVDRWEDAERAIEFLKQTQSGRATFHPLDTVRGRGGSPSPRVIPGVRGLASDLIEMDERVRPVVDGLLGRVFVADDLAAARVALRSLPTGWSVVTIGGEIARSSGTVTGGSRIKETGALARERELRELPRLRSQLEKQQDDLVAEIRVREEALRDQRQRKSDLERDIEVVRAESRERTATRVRAERELHEIERETEMEKERGDGIDLRVTMIQHELTDLSETMTRCDAQMAQVIEESEKLRVAIENAREAENDEPLQAARTELSGLQERLRGMEDQRSRLDARKRDLDAQRQDSERRLAELDVTIRDLNDMHEAAEVEHVTVTQQLTTLRKRHDDLQAAHQSGLRAEALARQELEQTEARCRELERRQDHLALESARRRDELDLTLERASRDFEVDDAAAILAGVTPAEDNDLSRLERDISRLRERLRRIGIAGDDAIEQFERESERYTFLRQQLDDVRAATSTLRTLMTELDRTMALEFDKTFTEVARVFETTFTALFGGGRARLIRCEDENGATGIDIVAQPPGKRLQNLSLLSGGERALTAVALLFSILKVNPSPFCLLDEVDAALDESNVVRVRDELQRLASKTQFVVVTHNRATIEGADTLYGITMGDDGISRVLSLRLPAESAS